jgi:hypothetical protein
MGQSALENRARAHVHLSGHHAQTGYRYEMKMATTLAISGQTKSSACSMAIGSIDT